MREYFIGIVHVFDARCEDAEQAQAFFFQGCDMEDAYCLSAGDGSVLHKKAKRSFALSPSGLGAQIGEKSLKILRSRAVGFAVFKIGIMVGGIVWGERFVGISMLL